MTTLIISRVLLAYSEPLIVVALDTMDRPYVGVNYADGDSAYLFYFSRVHPGHIDDLLEQKVDVRYLVTKHKIGRYEFGELWGDEGESVKTTKKDKIAMEWLPRPGMFIPTLPAANAVVNHRTVHIDGRWGIEDLRKFSNLVQDCYAFVYALSGKGTQTVKWHISSLFSKYPWRGGFSSVNFFDELYKKIPTNERAIIKRIQYASPGQMEFRMDADIGDSIRSFVENLNSQDGVAAKSYDEARSWLRAKRWLGKAADDLELSDSDVAALLERVSILALNFGLRNSVEDIVSLASSDPLAAVKILLAYYRRLANLADYVATGKARDLFAASS